MAYLEETRSRSTPESLSKRGIKGATLLKAEQWIRLLMVVGVLASWELCVQQKWISALFFPAPSTIAQTFVVQIGNGELLAALGATLGRLTLGLLSGGLAGLVLGLWMGWSPRLRTVVDPFVAAFHAIPKISILPLAMLVFGIGEMSKLVLIATAAFFPLLLNTMTGVRHINPLYLAVAHHYGATGYKLFRRVILPATLPLILTGLRLALNATLVTAIAIELLSANQGLGATIWLAWETLRTEELYVALCTTALLGIGFNYWIQWCEYKLIYWQ